VPDKEKKRDKNHKKRELPVFECGSIEKDW
jgi:hypothetical protein